MLIPDFDVPDVLLAPEDGMLLPDRAGLGIVGGDFLAGCVLYHRRDGLDNER